MGVKIYNFGDNKNSVTSVIKSRDQRLEETQTTMALSMAELTQMINDYHEETATAIAELAMVLGGK